MLLNVRSFDGSTLHLDTYRRLITTFGDIHWLREFEPMRFPNHRIILGLLYLFYCHRVCCFMSGSLVFYSAGVFDGFASAALFIALKDTPIVHKIFQRGPHAPEIFTFGGYKFELLDGGPDAVIVYYEISKGPFFI